MYANLGVVQRCGWVTQGLGLADLFRSLNGLDFPAPPLHRPVLSLTLTYVCVEDNRDPMSLSKNHQP